MNEFEKVAILLIALGPKRAQRILDRLGADDLLPIVETLRRMKKITPEERESVLEEVNGILEDLAAASFPGNEFDPEVSPTPDSSSSPEFPEAPAAPPSARDILEQVKDELPDRIEPKKLPDIDWDAAGFDFGSGNRAKREDDDDTPFGSDRRR